RSASGKLRVEAPPGTVNPAEREDLARQRDSVLLTLDAASLERLLPAWARVLGTVGISAGLMVLDLSHESYVHAANTAAAFCRGALLALTGALSWPAAVEAIEAALTRCMVWPVAGWRIVRDEQDGGWAVETAPAIEAATSGPRVVCGVRLDAQEAALFA